jgi:hypothetical protein
MGAFRRPVALTEAVPPTDDWVRKAESTAVGRLPGELELSGVLEAMDADLPMAHSVASLVAARLPDDSERQVESLMERSGDSLMENDSWKGEPPQRRARHLAGPAIHSLSTRRQQR